MNRQCSSKHSLLAQAGGTEEKRGDKGRRHCNSGAESTASYIELSKFFGPHRVPGKKELSEFLLADMCVCQSFAELTEFAAELSELSVPK